MIDTVYIESGLENSPVLQSTLAAFPRAHTVNCDRYGEVFNRRAQNFRLQKKRPSLILAQKRESFVLPAPEGYGIGEGRNFYFSHMLNCLYDCRYCFLQGMYASANYVWFVNYDGFHTAITDTVEAHPGENLFFFSGYDCDSLALDSITGFVDSFVPLFEQWPNAWLELRTKSVATKPLLAREPAKQTIVAFSLSPAPLAEAIEIGAPPLHSRLRAAKALAEAGWKVGLRFDPVMYDPDYPSLYGDLFREAFATIPEAAIHSVSLGPMRFPKSMFDRIAKLYPEEALFAGPLTRREGMVSYERELEAEMHEFCASELERYLPTEKLFTCLPPGWS